MKPGQFLGLPSRLGTCDLGGFVTVDPVSWLNSDGSYSHASGLYCAGVNEDG